MSSDALQIDELFSRPGSPSYPFYDADGQLCWVEAITERGGRLAIKQKTPSGERIITPAEFQVRTRVHEYGGQCFCQVGELVYFNNYADGLIYRQSMRGLEPPEQVSAETPISSAYADLHYAPKLNALIAIQELQGEKNTSRIIALNLEEAGTLAPICLVEGADFYANACVSPDARQIAWVQWANPNMPWDETRLKTAPIVKDAQGIRLGTATTIAGGGRQSICQIGYLANGELVFAMDCEADADADTAENYWNFYRLVDDALEVITQTLAEFGEAHWIFGQRRWVQRDEQTLLALKTQDDTDQLVSIDLTTGEQTQLDHDYARLSQLSTRGDKVLCIAAYVDRSPEIIAIQSNQVEVQKAQENWIQALDVSLPERLNFATRDGAEAFANYYPADISSGKTAALLVLVHGGPSSRADTALTPLVQYFCQNGFAVLDVNHRGSTGHGRAYRQALLGQWGEIDADDIADAIAFIIEQKQLDADRVFIRGGSAGGYAVLRALTRFPDLFCGGACYYGIGNLITLAEITHKFEGHYTDQLIGEVYDPITANQPDSRFRSRSPIFDIDKIKSPLILFQGLEDKVVPPDVSREMVETLKQNNVMHEYVEYPGEGHGFRQAETKMDALRREFSFFQKVLAGG